MKNLSLLATAATTALCSFATAQRDVALYSFENRDNQSATESAAGATDLDIDNAFVFGGPRSDRWLCLTTAWNNVGGSIEFTVTPEAGKSLSFTRLFWEARTGNTSLSDSVSAARLFANNTLVGSRSQLLHNEDVVFDLSSVAALQNTFDPIKFTIEMDGNPTGLSPHERASMGVETAECVENLSNSQDRILCLPINGATGSDCLFHALDGFSFRELADGTAQLLGAVVNVNDPCKRFIVDVTLDSFVADNATPPAGSPNLNSTIASLLVTNGGTVDPADWRYYETMSGSLIGRNCYEGAVLNVTRLGEAFQIGDAANLETPATGASGSFSVSVVQQPNDPNCQIAATDGEINLELGETCACMVETMATSFNYGAGTPGCDGVPSLAMTNAPLLVSEPQIAIGNGPNPRPGAMFWSGLEADIFLPILGGNLLVGAPLAAVTPLIIEAGGSNFDCMIFENPCQDNTTAYLQVICLDPCGPNGLSATRGLAINFGGL